MTQYGGWVPYEGAGAVLLALLLLAIGLILEYIGMRLERVVRVQALSRVASVFTFLTWSLSIATLLVFYSVLTSLVRSEETVQPPNPITPITIVSGICTFIIIAYMLRGHGPKLALGSAFVGTAAAPMIFELPFDLIIVDRTSAPVFLALLFFLPLFLGEVSTMALLLISPLTNLSKYTMFALGGMFIVFGVWAFFGFSFPSTPISYTLNVISKILCFITAITLFLNNPPHRLALGQ